VRAGSFPMLWKSSGIAPESENFVLYLSKFVIATRT
jgi:hypothetical protein